MIMCEDSRRTGPTMGKILNTDEIVRLMPNPKGNGAKIYVIANPDTCETLGFAITKTGQVTRLFLRK